jgi:DNA-binding transcriptional LysR family regulator
MRITLRQLCVFEAIARHGSVSRGADEVAMSQSAASMALKELEEGLRVTLFHRNGKQLTLNENGRRIQPLVRSLLTQVREMEYIGPALEMTGVLRIGASTTIGNYLAGRLCAQFARRYPEVRIKLQVMVAQDVMRQVESMSCDLGLIEAPCNRAALVCEPLCNDEVVVFAAPDHPLAKRESVTVADLCAAQWCLSDASSSTRSILTLGLAHSGLSIVLETNSAAAIKMAVTSGLGLGCLSRVALEREFAAGELTPLSVQGLVLRRHFNLLSPKGVYKGGVQDAFIAMAREMLSDVLQVA